MEKRKPDWLKIKIPMGASYAEVDVLLKKQGVHTICREGACPNRNECWGKKNASFLILGKTCTRNCRFCNVDKEKELSKVDWHEPFNLAAAVSAMALKHVVITSVTRDDLPDGGASHFVRCVRTVRAKNPQTAIEVLVPDFRSKKGALEQIIEASPDVFGHNIETVPRLFSTIRPLADYAYSLAVLKNFKEMSPGTRIKSGMMVGLGEEIQEIGQVMDDLKNAGVDFLTIGQYLRPSENHISVHRYVSPAEFKEYEKMGLEKGFSAVYSGPFVRSSYHAGDLLSR